MRSNILQMPLSFLEIEDEFVLKTAIVCYRLFPERVTVPILHEHLSFSDSKMVKTRKVLKEAGELPYIYYSGDAGEIGLWICYDNRLELFADAKPENQEYEIPPTPRLDEILYYWAHRFSKHELEVNMDSCISLYSRNAHKIWFRRGWREAIKKHRIRDGSLEWVMTESNMVAVLMRK